MQDQFFGKGSKTVKCGRGERKMTTNKKVDGFNYSSNECTAGRLERTS